MGASRHLDHPGWKGLGRTSIPSPHFPNEKTRIQEDLPRDAHAPHLRDATCNLFCLVLLFCCLDGSKFSKGNE